MTARIYVEIIRGHRTGARGWHDGSTDRTASGRHVVRLPGCSFPRDAVLKRPGDLRRLTDVELIFEQIKREAA